MSKVKAKVNKSELIRGVLAATPGATPANIVKHIKEKYGVDVTAGLIYLVKAQGKKSKHRRRAVPMTPPSREDYTLTLPRNGQSDVIAVVRKAKALAADVGGMPRLKAIVEAICE